MNELSELQFDLGYTFKDGLLLAQALTHSSHANERNAGLNDNEQLEFLGDAVLGFLVSDFLYRAHPGLTEGQLSKLKGFFVSSANLVKYAERVRLGGYLQLGKGEEKTGGRTKQALLVDALEAVLGAIYLDGGIEEARRVILPFFEAQIEESGDADRQLKDFKTELQEQLQAARRGRAEYVLANEAGPDHEKLFTVEVIIDGEPAARGVGLTKKAAEQAAARQALERVWGRQKEAM
ncbi:MAG TPA: ribonuclease III [Terriglobia bacterium]|jgi:ribonuclease-3